MGGRAEVAEKLFKMATGQLGADEQSGNPVTQIFWLSNRQRHRWQQRQHVKTEADRIDVVEVTVAAEEAIIDAVASENPVVIALLDAARLLDRYESILNALGVEIDDGDDFEDDEDKIDDEDEDDCDICGYVGSCDGSCVEFE